MDLQEHPDAWRYIIARIDSTGSAVFVPNVVYFDTFTGVLRRMVKQQDGSWLSVEESTVGCIVVESFG